MRGDNIWLILLGQALQKLDLCTVSYRLIDPVKEDNGDYTYRIEVMYDR